MVVCVVFILCFIHLLIRQTTALNITMIAHNNEMPEDFKHNVDIGHDFITVKLFSANTSIMTPPLYTTKKGDLEFIAVSPLADQCFSNISMQRLATLSLGAKPNRCNVGIKWTKDQFFINEEEPISAKNVRLNVEESGMIIYGSTNAKEMRTIQYCAYDYETAPTNISHLYFTHFSLSSAKNHPEDPPGCVLLFQFSIDYYKVVMFGEEDEKLKSDGAENDRSLTLEAIIMLGVIAVAVILIIISIIVYWVRKSKGQKKKGSKKAEDSVIVTANSEASQQKIPAEGVGKPASMVKQGTPPPRKISPTEVASRRERNKQIPQSSSMHSVQASFGGGGGGGGSLTAQDSSYRLNSPMSAMSMSHSAQSVSGPTNHHYQRNRMTNR